MLFLKTQLYHFPSSFIIMCPQATPLGLRLRASPARQSSESLAFASWVHTSQVAHQGLFIHHHHLLDLAQICVLNKN